MKIYITLPGVGNGYLMLEHQSSDQILNLKQSIRNRMKIRDRASKKTLPLTEYKVTPGLEVSDQYGVENQVLIYNNQILENNRKIEDYNLNSDSVIHLDFLETQKQVW